VASVLGKFLFDEGAIVAGNLAEELRILPAQMKVAKNCCALVRELLTDLIG
jgi:hypothetical protein